METSTIGFTNKSAEKFFKLLRDAEVKTLLDVRLNNTSQLSGFAKKADLEYFLSQLISAEFIELRELAPEKDMLRQYQRREINWSSYATKYIELLAKRQVENNLDVALFDRGCLLCSEDRPHHCHRRLSVEYLNARWNHKLNVTHLY